MGMRESDLRASANVGDVGQRASIAQLGAAGSRSRRRLVIVGAGVVGTATGCGFAAMGHDVAFCDAASTRRTQLRKRGLRVLAPAELPAESFDAYLISVPTPTVDGNVDLSCILAAAESVGHALAARKDSRKPLVVVRSTVPPGTTEGPVREVLERASGRLAGSGFHLCMNPEFLREVSAEQDFMEPRVIVIGALDEQSDRALRRLYRPWPGVPVVSLSLRSAELAKYTSNLFNAAKISFFNELEEVALALDADARAIFSAVSQGAEGMWNPVYGTRGLAPYGGACLPKDTEGFLGFAAEEGFAHAMPMLQATIETNERVAARLQDESHAQAI
jgi:UDPglucose 6-dehydrogenase